MSYINNREEPAFQASWVTLGIAAFACVFADIGTGPLYALNETFLGQHSIPVSRGNVMGVLSLLFWSLILIGSLKYVMYIMQAHNRGEGGIMALTALAMQSAGKRARLRTTVVILGILGAAMFYGDGMITPAISMLSSVEGLGLIYPDLQPLVPWITLMLLGITFSLSRNDLAGWTKFFSYLMVLWFVLLAMLGSFAIAHMPGILRALMPFYAVNFVIDHTGTALYAMGTIVLVVTGVEALYAHMGQFGQRPIQLAWFFVVLPALLLNYFGQGALLLADPISQINPFFRLSPDWGVLPLALLGILISAVTTLAVVAGAFSMTRQAMQLGFLPRMRVKHPSTQDKDQVYMPVINWLIFSGGALLIYLFRDSSHLAAAYGLAATAGMIIASLLAAVVAARLWDWGRSKSLLIFGGFIVIEMMFIASATSKIQDGGWFPLVVGGAVFILVTTWRQGQVLLGEKIEAETLPFELFVESLERSPPPRVPGTGVYLTHTLDGVPHAMLHNLRHNKVLHETVVVIKVKMLDIPYVPDNCRIAAHPLPHGFWMVELFYGFKDNPDLPAALEWAEADGLLVNVRTSSFFLGRESLVTRRGGNMMQWRARIFQTMFRNAGSATEFFSIPSDRVVELGAQVVL